MTTLQISRPNGAEAIMKADSYIFRLSLKCRAPGPNGAKKMLFRLLKCFQKFDANAPQKSRRH